MKDWASLINTSFSKQKNLLKRSKKIMLWNLKDDLFIIIIFDYIWFQENYPVTHQMSETKYNKQLIHKKHQRRMVNLLFLMEMMEMVEMVEMLLEMVMEMVQTMVAMVQQKGEMKKRNQNLLIEYFKSLDLQEKKMKETIPDKHIFRNIQKV